MHTIDSTDSSNTPPARPATGPAEWLTTLRRLRRERGWTQHDLAREARVSRDSVASWECGRGTMSPRLALRMSAALGVDLLAGDNSSFDVEAAIATRVAAFERALRDEWRLP